MICMENHDHCSLSYGNRREVYVGFHSLRLVISLCDAYYASNDKGKQNKQEFLLNNNNCFYNKLIKWCEVMLNYEKQPGRVTIHQKGTNLVISDIKTNLVIHRRKKLS